MVLLPRSEQALGREVLLRTPRALLTTQQALRDPAGDHRRGAIERRDIAFGQLFGMKRARPWEQHVDGAPDVETPLRPIGIAEGHVNDDWARLHTDERPTDPLTDVGSQRRGDR